VIVFSLVQCFSI